MNTNQFANIILTSVIFSWRKYEQTINNLIISVLPNANDALWILILWEIDGKKDTSTSMWELLFSVLIVDQLKLVPFDKAKTFQLSPLFSVFMIWYKLVFCFMVVKRRVWSGHQCQTKRYCPMLVASNVCFEHAQLSTFSLQVSPRFHPILV